MFKMFKKRQKKVFRVSFITCSATDNNKVTFDKNDKREFFVEAETLEAAAGIFAKNFFYVSSRAAYILGIEELTIRR